MTKKTPEKHMTGFYAATLTVMAIGRNMLTLSACINITKNV